MDPATIALIASGVSIAVHLTQMVAKKWFPAAAPVAPVLPTGPSAPAFGQGLLQFIEQEGVKFLQGQVGSGTQTALRAGASYMLKQFASALETPAPVLPVPPRAA